MGNARYGFTRRPEKGKWCTKLKLSSSISSYDLRTFPRSRPGSPLESWKGEERSREDVSLGERGWKATRATPSLRCITFELLPLSLDSTTIVAIRSCFGFLIEKDLNMVSLQTELLLVCKVYREKLMI